MTELRKELPPLPDRIAALPVEARGYPVPWFVVWLDEDGRAVPPGQGTPDFRVIAPGAIAVAFTRDLCWVCGGPMGSFKTFTIGPMCAVNRTSAEPPSHLDCADWSARACPFLARPHARRRDAGKPEGVVEPAGIMLERNPGVALVWTTRGFHVRSDFNGGVLFKIGEPEHVRWYAEGREATRDEVCASIDSGLPALRELAEQQRGGVKQLDKQLAAAMELVPA